ncbi:MAG: aminotransferase class I/II-fold pyridoxal phosphate-dependent enzyme [Planctomycetota bacterium]|nr:aminotransferase class I/II-fold pyridoxal phosphate-dependent enzyme [Planctomycetota bacterium]
MKKIYLSPPDVGPRERELLLDAFDSNWIAPLGPHVDAFERELAQRAGVAHGAALASGTAALHLALHLVGVKPGGEVLVSTLTFAATAFAATYAGAEPVFIDAEAASWNMDPGRLEEELKACAGRGRPPAAVICVDLYGQCADYDAIEALCARYDVPLIEDAAEALGASYKGRPAGSFGALAAFSFNGNKIITTSGGGMLVSRREDWIVQARKLASQAREPAPHYEHAEIGYNYRLSNLLAALGRAQLEGLDAKIEKRRRVRRFYEGLLAGWPGVSFMPDAPHGVSNGWLTCVLIDPAAAGGDREDLRRHLEAAQIEARPVWKPMHLQPVFQGKRRRGGAVAEGLFERGLCLPSGSNLGAEELKRIEGALRAFPGWKARVGS